MMAEDFNMSLIPERAKKYFEENRNVLIVEDDKLMGQVVAEILTDIGFEVSSASNGRMAFEILEQKQINFIILDILLPEIDGFEIYRRLQAIPDKKDIPTMIVSAWSDKGNIDQAAGMGIHQFLAKPFTEDELISAILTLLVDSGRGRK